MSRPLVTRPPDDAGDEAQGVVLPQPGAGSEELAAACDPVYGADHTEILRRLPISRHSGVSKTGA
jgi:hypothetical protein